MSAVLQESTDKNLTVTVNVPSVMEHDAKVLLLRIEAATVESDEGYIALTDALGAVKRRRDAFEVDRVKIKKPVLTLGKELDAMFQAPISILDSAIFIGKEKLLAYDEVKRIQAEEARKEAEVEREAIQAEQRRIEQETQAKVLAEEAAKAAAAQEIARQATAAQAVAEAQAAVEVAKRQAAEALASNNQAAATAAVTAQWAAEAATKKAREEAETQRQAALAARMAQLKAERATAVAVAILDRAHDATLAVTARATARTGLTKSSGSSRRQNWFFRVTDLSKIDRKWLMLDDKRVQEFVTANKEGAAEFLGEGFEVWSENAIAINSKVKS